MVEKNSYYIISSWANQRKAKQSILSVFLDSESISFQRSILFHNNVLQYPSVVRPDQACRGSFPAQQPQSSGSKIFSVGLFYYRAQGPTLLSYSLLFMVQLHRVYYGLKGANWNFGTLSLILFTSKFFRWKFYPCPSF